METNLKYEEWWPNKCKYRRAELRLQLQLSKTNSVSDIYTMKGWSCTVL